MSRINRLMMPLSRLRKLGGISRRRVKASVYRPWVQDEWVNVLPIDAASLVISKSVGARHSDQQFNLVGVAGSVLLIGVVLTVWVWLAAGGTRHGLSARDFNATQLVRLGGSGVQIMFTDTPSMAKIMDTLTLTPSETMTLTPSLTSTEVPRATWTVDDGMAMQFLYSYYDPALGGVNCEKWDDFTGECVSMMANGLDWRKYYDIAVACPLSYPLGTKVTVISPAVVAHDWVCMDYCPVCKEGDIIDFLQRHQALPWRAPVSVKVYFP